MTTGARIILAGVELGATPAWSLADRPRWERFLSGRCVKYCEQQYGRR
jgi:hypothetical protein